ncbi:N-acetylglucosamine-6-phosphate deacetylase [Leekyejoonella antrihumi]|uniref:N-acetylglucosamine-6-phosphate deacetylase n=1 Tax=Leekyejoonella antrihumi TaxID=1660198 RepID=A0A563E2L0_9MICO|nr:N-acetylglucosamine-6-phosphate deacetylase [Leekyejoonella antrihumi]TWP36483.1 N-acetylglucosamine-6-phosphate deacetylase [Leekyejoonella antrihumi]
MTHIGSTVATDVVLTGARVVTPNDVIDNGWVHVRGSRIHQVGRTDPPRGVRRQDLAGAWLLPGYIDIHMHGGGGHDVSSSPEAMAQAVAFHRAHGTTRTLVSFVTAPVDALVEQLDWAAALTHAGARVDGHVIGSHLEGPFLSHARCGAQNTSHLILPDRDAFARMSAAARGTLRSVTIAPELDGALELIRDITASGAVAAIGHSDATYAQAHAAIDAGATLATHLFNGMRPLHHREPGPVGAALESGIACELINDGIHVHPSVTSLVARQRGPMILITDAMDATGVGDGEYVLGGQRVQVTDGQARLVSTGSLAGSTLTMDESLRRAVRDSGLTITSASRAASWNPARILGIHRDAGAIEAGLAADLVTLDDDLHVTGVMAEGLWSSEDSGAPEPDDR